jgi:hypothetical protein
MLLIPTRVDAQQSTWRVQPVCSLQKMKAPAHQAADPGKIGIPGYGGQAIPVGQFDDLLFGASG